MSVCQVSLCLSYPQKQKECDRQYSYFRRGPSLEHLQTRFETHKQFWDEKLKEIPLKVPKGVYIGSSSCSDYTSALGAGQKVLSYTYYSPWRTVRKQYV